ncbi:MAG: ABC transporter permease [Caldilineaceae bacterium]|nr:ABC transporter permease [Caldilineaceae bacterium]
MTQSVEVRTFTPAGNVMPLSKRLATLLHYRGLIYNLVLRELKARYKNSALGFLWSLLNPLAMMLVFTIVFGVLWPNDSIEKYPLFLLCGLLPWNFFSSSVMSGLNSVVNNANLVKKVYFPREALPIAAVLAQLVNFLLAFVVLFGVLIIFRSNFSPWLWLLPFVILIQTCFALGIALLLSAVNVFYRDTLMVMDVVILAWFFLTPVLYTVEFLPATVDVGPFALDVRRLLYIFNPMASFINMYRDLLYWGYRTDLDFFLRTAFTALAMLAIGYWFFNRYSGRFGEEV